MADIRIYGDGVPPPEIPDGWVLAHNHVQHGRRGPAGPKGFRWWVGNTVPKGFELCGCGWMDLTHYALVVHARTYKAPVRLPSKSRAKPKRRLAAKSRAKPKRRSAASKSRAKPKRRT